jgi:ion channel
MKPVTLPRAFRKKTWWLIAGWLWVGLVWPALGFCLAGNSAVLKDAVVGLGCTCIVVVYLATVVILFQRIQDLGQRMGLLATAYFFSALCIIIIFASYITYFSLYIQNSTVINQPMLHEDLFDPLYLSATTFTTLGIGDLLPAGFAGKFLIATESLIGTTHAVSFVTLLLVRISAERAAVAQEEAKTGTKEARPNNPPS